MKPIFNANNPELIDAWARAIEHACGNLDCDPRCLDWLSYTPDFHIRQDATAVAA